ncbi:hypothetical protein OSB04_un000396 [Centaurea solstitialis]|uniref:Reverse transcriptase domain-containing protein n=1 Tax=Centaurea solstitialis TaxID=347529 RepID=A0AA38SQM3_9ASTR|nr:hypothetical protein OSB04_un000396 [Centaurea solstitialis]
MVSNEFRDEILLTGGDCDNPPILTSGDMVSNEFRDEILLTGGDCDNPPILTSVMDKSFLSQLIGPDQSAFIPGRRISDNILMAHELVAGYQSVNVNESKSNTISTRLS